MASSMRRSSAVVRVLLLLAAAAATAKISTAFIYAGAPQVRRSHATALKQARSEVMPQSVSQILDAYEQDIEQRVQTLREASMEACVAANEDSPDAMEICRVLSYELATAEQMKHMKQNGHTYAGLDSDSY